MFILFGRLLKCTSLLQHGRDEAAFMHRSRYVAANLCTAIGREDVAAFYPVALQDKKRLEYDLAWNEVADEMGLPAATSFKWG